MNDFRAHRAIKSSRAELIEQLFLRTLPPHRPITAHALIASLKATKSHTPPLITRGFCASIGKD
jgi:hypothetical protein